MMCRGVSMRAIGGMARSGQERGKRGRSQRRNGDGSARPVPFLKWAGGKRQLLAQFGPYFPEAGTYGKYLEPFVGGGAVFFHLLPEVAILSDTNGDLMECYEVIREDVEGVIRELRKGKNEKEFFYAMRAKNPRRLGPVKRVARTIYLNKTCYNGLYRVNRKGEFNVPFGKYKNPTICDEVNLREVSEALRGVELKVRPFEAVVDDAEEGDLVYLDPPYQPLSVTSSFTGYTKDAFGEADQRRLAEVFRELDGMGCWVMLSNSDASLIRELYRGYRIERVMATRAINSRRDRRGKIPEVLVLNEGMG